jgi:hypothetical protein
LTSEVGTSFEELGPAGAQDDQGRVLDSERDFLEEIEEPVVGPVDVIDDQYERPVRREQADEAAPCPPDRILGVLLGDALRLHPDCHRERLGNLVGVGGAELRGECLQSARDRARRILR